MNNLTVISVLYHSDHLVENFYKSIVSNPCVGEVIFINNSSSDCRSVGTKGKIVGVQKNLGYGAALNKGISLASNDFIVFCNPDIVLHKFELTCNEIKENKIYAGMYKAPDNRIKCDAKPFPTPIIDTIRFSLLRSMMDKIKDHLHRMKIGFKKEDKSWGSGAMIVMKKETFMSVGGFDENFFLFYEEIDLYKRLSKKNILIENLPSIVWNHKDIKSSSIDVSEIKASSEASSFYLYHKKHNKSWLIPWMAIFILKVQHIMISLIYMFCKNKYLIRKKTYVEHLLKGLTTNV